LEGNQEAYLANPLAVEQAVRDPRPDLTREPWLWQLQIVSALGSRIRTRKVQISPAGSEVVDRLGHKAVAARNLALRVNSPPDWRRILHPNLDYIEGSLRELGEPNHGGPGASYL
jgi:hypothetical protein